VKGTLRRNPGTAQHVARQIGLTPMDEVITGQELDRMDNDELLRPLALRLSSLIISIHRR
jgi:magnesium-transporting ATPase (P-type)